MERGEDERGGEKATRPGEGQRWEVNPSAPQLSRETPGCGDSGLSLSGAEESFSPRKEEKAQTPSPAGTKHKSPYFPNPALLLGVAPLSGTAGDLVTITSCR
jgi:hypothetical protein